MSHALRFLPIGIRIGVLALGLGAAATPSTTAAAAVVETFTLPEDASRDLAQVLMYRKFFRFGSDYSCQVRVTVPGAGEAPLFTTSNSLICEFNLEDGRRTKNEYRLGNSTVEIASEKADSRSFTLKGEFPHQTINMLHLAFTQGRAVRTLPADLHWTQKVSCENGVALCLEQYVLHTVRFPGAANKSVPQVLCQRLSQLAVKSKFQLNRADFSSDEAYRDELILRQTLAHERVFSEPSCTFFVADVVGESAVSAVDPATSQSATPVSLGTVPTADLRTITYAVFPEELGLLDHPSPTGRTAINFYKLESDLNPYLSRYLSAEGARYAQAMQNGKYPGDARMLVAYQFAADALKPLYSALKPYSLNITIFGHLLTLIPDPDRWFLLSALRQLTWRVEPAEEFNRLIPARWRPFGERVATFRVGNMIHLNEAFLKSTRIGQFNPKLMEGFEYLLLWETLKLFLPAEGDVDFASFTQRFSRMIQQGTLDEFRVKDSAGRYPLTFLTPVETIQNTVRATSQWPWHFNQAALTAIADAKGAEIRFLAPFRIESENGGARETFSFLFRNVRPGHLDGLNTYLPIELGLFCDSLTGSFPQRARVTPVMGRIRLEGATPEWKGLEDVKSRHEWVTIQSKATCMKDLKDPVNLSFLKTVDWMYE
jgi:hypothetical protein